VSDELSAFHDAHHARLDALLWRVVDAVFDIDVARARAALALAHDELLAGLALEDDVIMPRYRAAFAAHPGPPQSRPDVVDGDHDLLRRGLDAVGAFLGDVDQAPADERRRAAAVGLPVVYRLIGTLEHHSEREQRHVYPVVAAALVAEPAVRAKTIAVLRDLAQRA